MSKTLGAFYTPQDLIKFIIESLPKKTKNSHLSILEPSCGDGRFIRSLLTHYKNYKIHIDGVEFDQSTFKNTKLAFDNNQNVSIIWDDFLSFHPLDKHYDLIIGNPPYINKKLLTGEQLTFLRNILSYNDISLLADKNIWTAFIVKSVNLLKDDGILAFVLPLELLQVKFSIYIQNFLKKSFMYIEIYTFDHLFFDTTTGQDTVVLIAHRKHYSKGISIKDVAWNNNKIKNLTNTHSELKDQENTTLKWSSRVLSNTDLEFLTSLSEKFKPVSQYIKSKPGIVTAANNYFITNKDTINKYKLKNYTKPIIQKSVFLKDAVLFNFDDYLNIQNANKPSFFIDLTEYKVGSNKSIDSYLSLGKELNIHQRFKCKNRTPWYKVPLVEPGEAIFFKRLNKHPKLLKNEDRLYTTDSAYNITCNVGIDINSFIFSFYNPLTLIFCELNGRRYGGGVLELIPSEFKQLPLPYIKVSEEYFHKFSQEFSLKENIIDILVNNGREILKEYISIEEFERLIFIYKKLVKRRLDMKLFYPLN